MYVVFFNFLGQYLAFREYKSANERYLRIELIRGGVICVQKIHPVGNNKKENSYGEKDFIDPDEGYNILRPGKSGFECTMAHMCVYNM